jgi:structural maintenance of chromosome 2
VQTEHRDVSAQLEDERKQLSAFDEELAELENVIKRKRDEIGKAEAAEKEADNAREQAHKDAKGAESMVRDLEKQHDWVVEEQGCAEPLSLLQELNINVA